MKIKKKLKSIEEQADENLNVVRKIGDRQSVDKKGRFVDHSEKHLTSGESVGLSVGTTVNVGDYESLRVDCWASTEVKEEETMEDALRRISSVIDKKLRSTVSFYTGDDED